MKRVLTLAASAIVTLGALGSRAEAAPATTFFTDGAVISMSVVPTAGRAEVVIGVNGAVTVQDFILRNPDKVVVDITGATLGVPAGASYDGVARGGILSVRYAQYKKNVVRVVLTLDQARPYSVVQGDKEVRIAVAGQNAQFASWSVGDRPQH